MFQWQIFTMKQKNTCKTLTDNCLIFLNVQDVELGKNKTMVKISE